MMLQAFLWAFAAFLRSVIPVMYSLVVSYFCYAFTGGPLDSNNWYTN